MWVLNFFLLTNLVVVAYGQAPVFVIPDPSGITVVSLDETAPIATSVLLTKTKNSSNAVVSIVNVTDLSTGAPRVGYFDMVGPNLISTSNALDYETVKAYRVVVKALDTVASTSSSATFVVRINDVNESPPSINVTVGWVYIAEERAPGTTVPFVFTVSDPDIGDTFTYALGGLHSAYFSIDSYTGGIAFSRRLDRDAPGAITNYDQITLIVTDAGSHTATAGLSITLVDINDNAPVCSPQIYAASINENTASGISVTTLFCTDIDVGTNAQMTYTIFSGDDVSAKFSMPSASVMTTSTPLDYETKSSYTLVVKIIDKGSPAMTGTATVLISVVGTNEFSPVLGLSSPAGPNYFIAESVSLATSVLTLTATDSDSGIDGQIDYILLSTFVGGSPTSGIFTVDAISGQLSTAITFDYESGVTSYMLIVGAKDRGIPARYTTTTITIGITDVNDNSPVFSQNFYYVSLTETQALSGNKVQKLTATDADITTGSLLYQIASGDTQNRFRISNTTTGLLELNTNMELDDPVNDPYVYVLKMQVSDKGVPTTPARTSTCAVTVTITPVNDYSPIFGTPTPSPSPTVAEDAPVGTTIATIPVTDADRDLGIPQKVTLTISSGNSKDNFDIDPLTGVVSIIKQLDYETKTSYKLVIVATDNGSPAKSTTMTLTVTVTNVNDNAPSCPSSEVHGVVPENAVGYQVASLACSDLDTDDYVNYTIMPADLYFTVGPASGIVPTISGLNYESRTNYSVMILVTDSIPVQKTSTVTLLVIVQPVNEFPPVFSPAIYTVSLAENIRAVTSLVTVTATDSDQGALDGTVRYYIVAGNGEGAFTINSTTGKVETTSQGLDFEKTKAYTLIIRANDNIPGAITERTGTGTVIITVTDVNDNVPICIPPLPVQIVEPSVIGATIATLTSTDDDESGTPNATPSYSIISGDISGIFTVTGSTLKLAKVVDYETQSSFSLTIRVSDSGTPAPLTSTCVVYVTIIASDEFPPLMTIPNYSTTIPETIAIGTTVFQAISTDADKGTGSTFTYSITSGNTNGDFYCYPDTGIIIVWNRLDFDTPPQTYNLTVTSTDTMGKNGSMWLFVSLLDSNDQTPMFTNNVYAINVQENIAVGSSVGTVSATDIDTGSGGSVTYTAVSGNGMSLFTVHPASGTILTIADIDRELRDHYSLVVKAADGGTPSLSSTSLVDITITDLNDNAPAFMPTDFTMNLREDAAIGTSVTTVHAADGDSTASNKVFSYVLYDAFFQIDAITGVIRTKLALDRETKGTHVLNILAPDVGNPSLTGTATVTIVLDDINDNYPIILGSYERTVAENIAVGTIVTTITTMDADSGDNARVTYTLVSGNTDSDFFLSSVNGYVQVRNSLDRERTPWYSLVVKAADNGSPMLSTLTVISVNISDINDNSPVWSMSNFAFTVLENQVAGTVCGQVSATDADFGSNALLTYSVVLFWTGNLAHFSLDPTAGFITTAIALDRESTAQYSALLRVYDGGNPRLSAVVNMTITVLDLNDNKPVFNTSEYAATIPENRPLGTSVLTLTVSDIDIGTNADVTYLTDLSSASGAEAAKYFDVNVGTGQITVKNQIDYEFNKSFTFVAYAVDGGTPALTSSVKITITIIDMNDNAPIFTQTYYNTEVAYTGKCATSIITVTATDADSGSNGEVYYYQEQSDGDNPFSVDSTSGLFSIRKAATANVIYLEQVHVRDGGSPTLTATTPVTIRVDAMVPDSVIITFHLGITAAAFKPQKAAFLAECQALVRKSYPSALVRLWCVETSSDGLADVHIYFLKDNSTESVAYSNVAKYYLTSVTARLSFTNTFDGKPSDSLSGSNWEPFYVKTVSPYYEDQTAWTQTTNGIATIAVCSLLGAVFLGLATYMTLKYNRLQKQSRPPTRKIKVEEIDEREPESETGQDESQPESETGQDGEKPSRQAKKWDDPFQFWDNSAQP